jgi:hypothetical protein
MSRLVPFQFLLYMPLPALMADSTHGADRGDCRWHRRVLSLLAAGNAPKRWVLKSPFHQLGYHALAEEWQGIDIVEVDRPRHEVERSWARLVAATRELFTGERARTEQINVEWGPLWEAADERRQHLPPGSRRVRVSFTDVVHRPVETARWVYTELGLPWHAKVQVAMDRWLATRA